ncbi:MAG: RNA-binding S4 domain-containing protein [Hyphomicrobiales bacterium]
MNQRLDKWLVYARFVKHRAQAQALVEEGAVRVNRQRIVKCSHAVKPDDILTVAVHGQVRVVKVLAAAERRGPASAAQLLYEDVAPAQKQDASPEALC